VTGITPLLGAVLLIGLGGLFAAVDAAISTASLARVEEMVRDERPGAIRLARVLADRPRYINLVVLLRITCEVTATVLLVSYLDGRWASPGPVHRRGHHGGDQLRGHRGGSATPSAGRTPTPSRWRRPFRCMHLGAAHPDQPAAGAGRQRVDPGPRLPQRPFASEIELREVVDWPSSAGCGRR
jgi:hypothetical protein